MTLGIRRATPEDAAALNALWKQLFRETQNLLWEDGEYQLSVDEERQRLAQLLARPLGLLLVAEDGGELVGFLNAMGQERRRRRHVAALAIAVARAHWNRGIGTALMREAIAWSLEAGLKRLELSVRVDNAAAIAVYRRCGFEIEGRWRASLRVGDEFVDEFLLSRLADG